MGGVHATVQGYSDKARCRGHSLLACGYRCLPRCGTLTLSWSVPVPRVFVPLSLSVRACDWWCTSGATWMCVYSTAPASVTPDQGLCTGPKQCRGATAPLRARAVRTLP